MSDDVLRTVAAKVAIQTDAKDVAKVEKDIAGIKDKLGGLGSALNLGPLTEGFEKLHGIFGKMTSGPTGVVVGIGAAATAFVGLAEKTAKHAGAMSKGALMSGMGVEAFQELAFAGKESGVDIEAMSHGLGKLSRTMYEAKTGSAEAKKAFKALGVDALDGNKQLRPVGEVVADLAEKFKDMPEGERVGKVMSIFGKSGAQMLPLLMKGKEGLKEFYEEAKRFGIILDANAIAQGKTLSKSKKTIAAAFEGIELQMGAAVLPVMAEAAKGMAGFMHAAQPVIAGTLRWGMNQVVSGIGLVKGALFPVTAAFDALTGLMERLGSVGDSSTSAVARGLKAFLSPISEAYATLEDMYRFLAGKSSSIGLGMAKDKKAYWKAATEGKSFDLSGNVVAENEAGVKGVGSRAVRGLGEQAAGTTAGQAFSAAKRAVDQGNYIEGAGQAVAAVANAPMLATDATVRYITRQITGSVNLTVNATGTADPEAIGAAVAEAQGRAIREAAELQP